MRMRWSMHVRHARACVRAPRSAVVRVRLVSVARAQPTTPGHDKSGRLPVLRFGWGQIVVSER